MISKNITDASSYRTPQELFSSFQGITTNNKSNEKIKSKMIQRDQNEAIKTATPTTNQTPFISNLVINNPKTTHRSISEGYKKYQNGEPFYYINDPKRLYPPVFHPPPHPAAGFYAMPNPYAALNYCHMNNPWKPGPAIIPAKKTVEKATTPETSKSKTFRTVQKQMASNQIPLCLVQDTNGKLHQLVYTVPASQYKKYVKEVAKGNNVKLQQLHVTKDIKVDRLNNNSNKSKEDVAKKTKNIPIIDLSKDECVENQKRSPRNSRKQTVNNGDDLMDTKVSEVSSSSPVSSSSSSPSLPSSSLSSLSSLDSSEKINEHKKKAFDENIQSIYTKTDLNPSSLNPSSLSNTTDIFTETTSLQSVESIESLLSDDSSLNKDSILSTDYISEDNSSYMSNSILSDDMIFTPSTITDNESEVDNQEIVGNLPFLQATTPTTITTKLENQYQPIKTTATTTSTTNGCLATIDDIILRHQKDLIPKYEVENLLMTLKRKFEESEQEVERKRMKTETNETLVHQANEIDLFEQFSPNYSSDDDNTLLLQSSMSSQLNSNSVYKPRDTLLNANYEFPHASLTTNSNLEQSKELGSTTNQKTHTSSVINNNTLLHSRESIMRSRDIRPRDPKRISSIDSTFSYSSFDSADGSPLLPSSSLEDILGNETRMIHNEAGEIKNNFLSTSNDMSSVKNDFMANRTRLDHHQNEFKDTRTRLDPNIICTYDTSSFEISNTGNSNEMSTTSVKLDNSDPINFLNNFQPSEMDLFEHFWSELEDI